MATTVNITIENNLGEALVRVAPVTGAANPTILSGTPVGASPANVASGATSPLWRITSNDPNDGVQGNITYRSSLNGRVGFVTLIFKSNNVGPFQAIVSDNPNISVGATGTGGNGSPLNITYTVG